MVDYPLDGQSFTLPVLTYTHTQHVTDNSHVFSKTLLRGA